MPSTPPVPLDAMYAIHVRRTDGRPWIGGAEALRYWLPIVGPSTFLLTSKLAECEGDTTTLLHVGESIGIGRRSLPRTLHRAMKFGVLRFAGSTVEVPGTFDGLSHRHVGKLPAWLRDEYRALVNL